jgi:hypothetical protein
MGSSGGVRSGCRGDQRSARRLDRAFDRAHAEGSPKSLARGSGPFKAKWNGWPGSLDGRRRKRVLVSLSGSRGAQSYLERKGLWLWRAKTQDGLYDEGPGLGFCVKPGGSTELDSQPIEFDEERSASDASCYVS